MEYRTTRFLFPLQMPIKLVVNSLSRRLDPQMGATIDGKDLPAYLSIGHPSFGTQY